MLTPQQVAEHAFTKATIGGYNMAMVDDFLELVTADYTTLYKENAALKAKMKTLVDKVEEYRSTEDSMRKAFLSAQKAADQLVAEAEAKKSTMLSDAQREIEGQVAHLRQEIKSEELRLTAAKNATAAYIAQLKELYQHEMEYLASLSSLSAQPEAPKGEDIGDVVEKAVSQSIAQEEAEEDNEPTQPRGSLYEQLKKDAQPSEDGEDDEDGDGEGEEPPASQEPTRRINFSDLQFGKDYKIE